jgi:hypothetical protein
VKQLPSENQLLQIPLALAHILKQGSISLQTDGVEHIQVTVQDNKIDYNFLQKELLKSLVEAEAETAETSMLEKLKTVKHLAEKLKQDRLTVTISHQGETMLTLGYEAKPTLSRIVTGTSAIEVNNMIELIKLVK